MKYSVLRVAPWRAALFIVALALSACTGGTTSTPPTTATAPGTAPVAPAFREFYALRGGAAFLGPAISEEFEHDGLTLQYVQSGLMSFDPTRAGGERYGFAPLGKKLGYYEPPNNPNPQSGVHIGDYPSDAAIKLLYQALGGERYVGQPLTNLRINPRHNRLEQHFENMGLARPLDDPNAPAYLLAYGVYDCRVTCRYTPPTSTLIDFPSILPEAFQGPVERLGSDLFGEVLAGPYDLPEGGQEVVFRNLVLYTDPDLPGRAFARPIVEMVGVQSGDMAPRLESPYIVFFPLQENRGHNIPLFFYEYVTAHGGLDVFGFPITEMQLVEAGVYRQCFTNLCLDYYETALPQIQPSPLGQEYKNRFVSADAGAGALNRLTLNAWEQRSPLTSRESQTIHLVLLADGAPAAGLEARLTVYLPDGSVAHYGFPATDGDGRASLTIPAVDAPNGAWVYFDVCVDEPGGEQCVSAEYLIWGN
ncbi:MAG: hypothetical protein HYZ26_08255 [Chloroflexi bacterium]|nr:hypothetical protein [Chloroflexota bacterium]